MSPDRGRRPPGTGPSARHPLVHRVFLAVMLVAVVLSGLGFAYKIVQFAREALGNEASAFAVPVLVYICMALGFICLLAWAALRGMFYNIERPKYRMLEREEEYERHGI